MLLYLVEFRKRALETVFCFLLLFLACFYFSKEIFEFLALPVLKLMPKNQHLIATEITAPLIVPLKIAADAALLLMAPIAIFQLWRFVAPALYSAERRPIAYFIVGSFLLFLSGMVFCFYLILPFMMQFFSEAVPDGVQFMPNMGSIADFNSRMLLIFGLCFQVPILCVFLVRVRWLDYATLKKIRPYVIVASFILGMLLTPPDVFSQISVAIPLCLLYELGILLVYFFCKTEGPK